MCRQSPLRACRFIQWTRPSHRWTAYVVERDAYPHGLPSLATLGVGAAVNRTVDASLASLTGGGGADRRELALAVAPAGRIRINSIAPAPFIHGVWTY